MKAHIVCLGTGRMGQGIAVAAARAGCEATLLDVKPRTAEAAEANRAAAFHAVDAALDALAEAGDDGIADRAGIRRRIGSATLAEAAAVLATADVVFEGVPEVLSVKESAFAAIADLLPAATIVASTSSSFLSTDLARIAPCPARFLNAHWLNPAYVIPLVEVSPHPGTDADVTTRLMDLLRRMGKQPVRCSAAPGYIVPRLQTLVMNEAARMVEDGVATAEDIDLAVRFGFGLRYANMGLLEFIDFGGNDILYYASRSLANSFDDARFASPPIVGRLMDEGHDGLKTGRGFYDWSDIDKHAYRVEFLKRLLAQVAMNTSDRGTDLRSAT